MKHLLITIAALLLVGCGESQQSDFAPEARPIERVEGAKAPGISIHAAASTGYIEGVKQHLAAGTDVNTQNEDGLTPLHRAVSAGKFAEKKEITKLLIANGANVNAKNKNGYTPLHYAAAKSHKEVNELLISKGAEVNAMSDDGETPLNVAISNKRTETAELLRKHGGKTGEELKAESE